WEPTKWVAKLRAQKTDHNALLLRMSLDPAGHGGKAGRYGRLHHAAVPNAVILERHALAPPRIARPPAASCLPPPPPRLRRRPRPRERAQRGADAAPQQPRRFALAEPDHAPRTASRSGDLCTRRRLHSCSIRFARSITH